MNYSKENGQKVFSCSRQEGIKDRSSRPFSNRKNFDSLILLSKYTTQSTEAQNELRGTSDQLANILKYAKETIKQEARSGILKRIFTLINKAIDKISGYVQSQESLLQELFNLIKIKENQLEKATKKLSLYELIELVNLPNIETEQEEQRKQRKITNKSIQVNPARTSLEEEQIEIKSFKLSKINDKIARMNFKIDPVQAQMESSIIGDKNTFVALKHPKSFLITTSKRGLKVIEKNKLIYSNLLPSRDGALKDVVYIPTEDCYLIDFEDHIYRKNIDGRPPYVYLEYKCGYRVGASFYFSDIAKRLIFIKDYTNIAVLNFEEKRVEIDASNFFSKSLVDFKVVGENHHLVLAASTDGMLFLYNLYYDAKEGLIIAHKSLNLMSSLGEKVFSIAACKKGTFVCVEVIQKRSACSRLILLKIEDHEFVRESVINQFEHDIGPKLALECHGYVGSHIL